MKLQELAAKLELKCVTQAFDVDNQLLPNTVPTLIKEWGQPRPAFVNALAAGPFGMMIGGVLGGVLGDRLGRRTALLTSVIAFAVLTVAISYVNTIDTLLVLRFLAGVGLGGAMPNAATLASEYVPRRQRPAAVTFTIVCIPLGGFVAAFDSTVSLGLNNAPGVKINGEDQLGLDSSLTVFRADAMCRPPNRELFLQFLRLARSGPGTTVIPATEGLFGPVALSPSPPTYAPGNCQPRQQLPMGGG